MNLKDVPISNNIPLPKLEPIRIVRRIKMRGGSAMEFRRPRDVSAETIFDVMVTSRCHEEARRDAIRYRCTSINQYLATTSI
jgi:hypothetical protein